MTPKQLRATTHAVVIIRCIWTRGADQKAALAELDRRRLWLSPDQKIAAGLS